MIVLDNSILSRTVRWRRPHAKTAEVLAALDEQGRGMVVPGIVLQEVLSGIPKGPQLDAVEQRLLRFRLVLATPEHHRLAARLRTRCQAGGVATTSPDALIAAHALIDGGCVLTSDRDFLHMAPLLPELQVIWLE